MSDAELIDALGGPTRLAQRLGYVKAGGVQRVQNWKARGIPAKVKLQWPALFLGAAAPVAVPSGVAQDGRQVAARTEEGAAHAA